MGVAMFVRPMDDEGRVRKAVSDMMSIVSEIVAQKLRITPFALQFRVISP